MEGKDCKLKSFYFCFSSRSVSLHQTYEPINIVKKPNYNYYNLKLIIEFIQN